MEFVRLDLEGEDAADRHDYWKAGGRVTFGTTSLSVRAQAVRMLIALRKAADARFVLMGRADDDWCAASLTPGWHHGMSPSGKHANMPITRHFLYGPGRANTTPARPGGGFAEGACGGSPMSEPIGAACYPRWSPRTAAMRDLCPRCEATRLPPQARPRPADAGPACIPPDGSVAPPGYSHHEVVDLAV
jgi:hypothetical protein